MSFLPYVIMNLPAKTLKILLLVIFVLTLEKHGLAFSSDALELQLPQNIYIEPQSIRSFIDDLNKNGKQGYKLKALERYTRFSTPEDFREIKIAGIMELIDGDTYEYKWFNTITLPQFVLKVNEHAKEGFYFSNIVSYSLLKSQNASSDDVVENAVDIIIDALSQPPTDGSLFILERKNNFSDPTEFALAAPKPDDSYFNSVLNRKITRTMEESFADIDTRNYQPVAVFFSSAVFKTRVSHLPVVLFQNTWEHNINAPRPNYKVVEVFQFGNKFRKRIHEVSTQGFEIIAWL